MLSDTQIFDPLLEHFPQGAKRLEFKSCENCPCWFLRNLCQCHLNSVEATCGCQKYCANCIQRMLMPPAEYAEREIIESATPAGRFSRKRHIHYDDSLTPWSEKLKIVADRKARVVALFLRKEFVTAEDIQEASGYKGTAAAAVEECRKRGLPIISVGYVGAKRRVGPPAKLYILNGVSNA